MSFPQENAAQDPDLPSVRNEGCCICREIQGGKRGGKEECFVHYGQNWFSCNDRIRRESRIEFESM